MRFRSLFRFGRGTARYALERGRAVVNHPYFSMGFSAMTMAAAGYGYFYTSTRTLAVAGIDFGMGALYYAAERLRHLREQRAAQQEQGIVRDRAQRDAPNRDSEDPVPDLLPNRRPRERARSDDSVEREMPEASQEQARLLSSSRPPIHIQFHPGQAIPGDYKKRRRNRRTKASSVPRSNPH